MPDRGDWLAYVNLEGGYQWVTADGTDVLADVMGAATPTVEYIFAQHTPLNQTQPIDGHFALHTWGIFEEQGVDEYNRSGLVMVLGLILDRSEQAEIKIDPKEMQYLSQVRANLVSMKINRDISRLAICGALNHIRTRSAPAFNSTNGVAADAKPIEYNVDRSEYNVDRSESAQQYSDKIRSVNKIKLPVLAIIISLLAILLNVITIFYVILTINN